MKLYDNTLGSNYDELLTYYPAYYREVREMEGLLRAFGAELDGIRTGNIRAVDNCFIMSADRKSIALYESFLGITYDGTRTLDERRSMVASFFVGNGHIGQRQIKELVSAFVTGDVTVSLIGGTIHVVIRQSKDTGFVLGDCLYVLGKRIPAHLGLVAVYIPPTFIFKNKNCVRLDGFGVEASFRTYISERVYLNGERSLDGSWHMGVDFERVPTLEAVGIEVGIKHIEKITEG